ncbi:MAG: hypothetical protein ABW078_09325 [Sedimenticola sp.]
MPYEIVWEEKGLHVKNHGRLMEQDLYEQIDETNTDPRIEKIDYMIWDALDVEHLIAHGSSTLIPAITDVRLSERIGRIKNALVATDPHIIEICRHYMAHMERFGSKWDVRLFDDLVLARDWIETDPPGF